MNLMSHKELSGVVGVNKNFGLVQLKFWTKLETCGGEDHERLGTKPLHDADDDDDDEGEDVDKETLEARRKNQNQRKKMWPTVLRKHQKIFLLIMK